MNTPLWVRLSLLTLAFSCIAHSASSQVSVPPGASVFGYTKLVVDDNPVSSDVTTNTSSDSPWFSGPWWLSSAPPLSLFSTQDGVLAVQLHGGLESTPEYSGGVQPTIPGSGGFYIEFTTKLSSNNSDHWEALWLEPVEHNPRLDDHPEGTATGFEEWQEFDVDESGFGAGTCGTTIAWQGTYPKYTRVINKSNTVPTALDRTVYHTFGFSYNPTLQMAFWWLDDTLTHVAQIPSVSDVASSENYYILMAAQSHGKNDPYTRCTFRTFAFSFLSRQHYKKYRQHS